MIEEQRPNGKMKKHVLVLNQSYEPMHICNMKRAVVMLYLGKAELIEKFDDVLHSVSKVMPMPSVVRLEQYIRIPNNSIILSRKNILKRDGHLCQYCGKKNIPLTVDHIIPKVKGGRDTWENLVTACVSCNNKKGNRTLKDFGRKPLNKPRRPNRVTFIQRFVKSPYKQWRPYIFID